MSKATRKTKMVYVCSTCGHQEPRWAGRCPRCENWNTMEEQEPAPSTAAGRSAQTRRNVELQEAPTLASIDPFSVNRISTGISEFDMVLGGGLVPGAFVLVAGEPGVGKSTLLLEMGRKAGREILYISGEESPAQIRLRAERMELPLDVFRISRQTDLDDVLTRLDRDRPPIVVIDSIQTIYSRSSGYSPGSPGQIREAAMLLMESCKRTDSCLIVTGHITREGTVAGPRLLEHMVDVVLYFESDRLNHHRLLRAIKNRFGPVGEIAVFEMVRRGLQEIPDYHSAILDSHGGAGRIFTAIREGSRAIAVEVQALVVRSAFGQARRMADGLDSRRLTLIAAVLEKYLKLNLSEYDIFANLAGGLTVDETGLDLAIAAAILSSYNETPAPEKTAYTGEVGLTGEVRPVGGIERRVRELSELGFTRIVIPGANETELAGSENLPRGITIVPIRSVEGLGALQNEGAGNDRPGSGKL